MFNIKPCGECYILMLMLYLMPQCGLNLCILALFYDVPPIEATHI